MKRRLLILITAAMFSLASLPADWQQGPPTNRGDCPNCPNPRGSGQGTPKRDGTGPGAQKGKRQGPQDGSGPIHTPQGKGRRGGR